VTLTRALLIGVVTSMRSIVPIAVLSQLARRGNDPRPRGPVRLLARPAVSIGMMALAAGELWGDKLPRAPNRTSLPGLAARATTGATVTAALAAPHRRSSAALVGGIAAVASAYLTLGLRTNAMRRLGQIPTGVLEDAIVLASALLLLRPSQSFTSRCIEAPRGRASATRRAT